MAVGLECLHRGGILSSGGKTEEYLRACRRRKNRAQQRKVPSVLAIRGRRRGCGDGGDRYRGQEREVIYDRRRGRLVPGPVERVHLGGGKGTREGRGGTRAQPRSVTGNTVRQKTYCGLWYSCTLLSLGDGTTASTGVFGVG